MGRRSFRFTCLAAVLLTSLTSASDWDRMKSIVPRGYVCYRAPSSLRIEGKLDDLAWRAAAWTDAFVDIEGDAKPRPRHPTRVKMLWDDAYFYFAAELEEPHVWATLTEHDSVIFRDNDFEVFVDPDGDNHDYYEFEINALATCWDLFLPRPYKDGGRAQNGWEIPGLKAAVHIDGTLNDPADVDHGWSVELAFPWKALAEHAHRPAPPRNDDQWRVNFSRVQWRTEVVDGRYKKVEGRPEDNWVWSPQGIVDMHRPERWGYVQFSTAPPGAAAFRPDTALPARELLMEIYHAQRSFKKQHRRFAATLDELGIGTRVVPDLASPPAITGFATGFRASTDIRAARGNIERWNVDHESRIWRETAPQEPKP